jgi:hypothetical protein
MPTLDKHDVKQIFRCLDQIKDLCDYMRHNHLDAPYDTVYRAVGGEGFIRELLMEKIVVDIQIDAHDVKQQNRPLPTGTPISIPTNIIGRINVDNPRDPGNKIGDS